MEKLEMWDYIAIGTILFSAWMAVYGLRICRAANKEGFNERNLRNRILGAAAASFLYLLIRFVA